MTHPPHAQCCSVGHRPLWLDHIGSLFRLNTFCKMSENGLLICALCLSILTIATSSGSTMIIRNEKNQPKHRLNLLKMDISKFSYQKRWMQARLAFGCEVGHIYSTKIWSGMKPKPIGEPTNQWPFSAEKCYYSEKINLCWTERQSLKKETNCKNAKMWNERNGATRDKDLNKYFLRLLVLLTLLDHRKRDVVVFVIQRGFPFP